VSGNPRPLSRATRPPNVSGKCRTRDAPEYRDRTTPPDTTRPRQIGIDVLVKTRLDAIRGADGTASGAAVIAKRSRLVRARAGSCRVLRCLVSRANANGIVRAVLRAARTRVSGVCYGWTSMSSARRGGRRRCRATTVDDTSLPCSYALPKPTPTTHKAAVMHRSTRSRPHRARSDRVRSWRSEARVTVTCATRSAQLDRAHSDNMSRCARFG
jgi:hypothetical protein